MCGIAGKYSKTDNNGELIANACLSMKTRGPDNVGVKILTNHLVFGHVRLSILDLSVESNQPLTSKCGRYTITFNGEIYNYTELRSKLKNRGVRCRTTGDTEVLLQMYINFGKECLNSIRGMFAFAVYDSIERKLFLARDIAGEKPLFYSRINREFCFASTLGGVLELLPSLRKINQFQLEDYLYYGYSARDNSLVDGVKKLPPGHWLEFDINSGDFKQTKYWSVPDVECGDDNNADVLKEILTASIEEQLVADVETSVLLSGGLDSSLITAFSSQVRNKVKTFSVSFSTDKAYDEITHANLIAEHFGTDHHVLNIGRIGLESLIEVCENMDEPVIDSSFIPTYFLAKEVGKHTRVVLGGDGADELFGGYSHYNRLLNLNNIKKRFCIDPYVQLSQKIINDKESNLYKWLEIASKDMKNAIHPVAVYFSDVATVLNHPSSLSHRKFERNGSLIRSYLKMDFENYLASDILVKVDRSMMSASVESRSPFLDRRLIEFAFRNVSDDQKVSTKSGKIILQEIAKEILPPGFQFGRKQGFNFNINRLMNDEGVKGFFWNELAPKEFFNISFVENLYKRHEKRGIYGEKLFGIFTLLYWAKMKKIHGVSC